MSLSKPVPNLVFTINNYRELNAVNSVSTGIFGPSKKKRENRRPEFENHQVENPKGIETWPDLDLTTFLRCHLEKVCLMLSR